MTPTEKEIIIAWSKAHEQARDNTTLLLANNVFSPLCVARMSVVHAANKLLYEMVVTPDSPEPLKRHLAANLNDCCDKCSGSSIRSNNHPECNAKRKEWFESQRALIVYAKLLGYAKALREQQ